MAKWDDKKQNTEEITTDKLLEQIEKEKKQMKTSSIFAIAALIAIVVLCIAWFASNDQVNANIEGVSTDDETAFWLASVGSRQNGELNYLKDEDGSNILTEGTKRGYSSYIDIKTGNTVSTGDRDYYTGISGLAWHMNGQQSFSPGGSGTLEFYVIPKRDNLKTVSITLDMIGYHIKEGANKASKVENEIVQNLIEGHILLFENLDDTHGYTGWLGTESMRDDQELTNKLTIKAPTQGENGTGTFQKGTPYKVTIYWVWPRYFRNYIYTQRSTQEDLFTDKINQETNSEYDIFVRKFINKYKQTNFAGHNNLGKFFFSAASENDQPEPIEATINNQMSDATLDACNQRYNQADEYIGDNVDYIYVEMEVE